MTDSAAFEIEVLGDRMVLTGAAADRDRFAAIVGQARQMQTGGGPPDPAAIRQISAAFAASPLSRPAPEVSTLQSVDAGGVNAVWFEPAGPARPAPILYLHGGGYVGGSVAASRGLAQGLADGFGARVLAVAYRQAPEARFPAAIDDALTSYAWLVTSTGQPVTVAGDSAGATLAVIVGLEASRRGLKAPHAVIAMSGVFDMAMTGASWTANAPLDVVTRGMGEFFIDAYMGDADRSQAYASPVNADFRGSPPLLIQVGSHELMLSDSEALAAAARRDGVDVRLEVYTGMPHNFTKFASPIADGAIARAAAWEAALP